MPQFVDGSFEVQDEGSQLLADLTEAKPGDLVLDYCAGAGGKALAFAPKLEGKGQVFLHDIRPHVLLDARKRLKRAGIQNSQIIYSEDLPQKNLKGKMDWVFVDAPCSGTGTFRRNPDMKWKLTPEKVENLLKLQREIFEKALSYLKPEGKIVYGTCSILEEENQNQADYFIEKHQLEMVGQPLQCLPVRHGPDGFFGIVFKRVTIN